MKIILDIHTKNNAHIREVTVESTAPPRIGEYIDPPDELLEWTQRLPLLVTDVRYRLGSGTLTAFVTCHAHGDDSTSHRLRLLQEQGWLQPLE